MSKKEIYWPVGEYGDGGGFRIVLDSAAGEWQKKDYCPHVLNNTIPAVVVAYAEAGHASTHVCLHCIVEAAKKHELI